MGGYLTNITRKEQIAISLAVRQALGLRQGDSVAVVVVGDQVKIERRAGAVTMTASILGNDIPPLAPEQEREAFELGSTHETGKNTR